MITSLFGQSHNCFHRSAFSYYLSSLVQVIIDSIVFGCCRHHHRNCCYHHHQTHHFKYRRFVLLSEGFSLRIIIEPLYLSTHFPGFCSFLEHLIAEHTVASLSRLRNSQELTKKLVCFSYSVLRKALFPHFIDCSGARVDKALTSLHIFSRVHATL